MAAGLAASCALLSCGPGGSNGGGGGRGVGDACAATGECREPLVCEPASGACQPAGSTAQGGECTLTGECAAGLYCGPERLCAPAGAAAEGGDCASTADCEAGLVCSIEGLGGRCRAPGEGDLGDPCAGPADCLAGLACAASTGASSCADPEPGQAGLPQVPLWPGDQCPFDATEPTAYFEVPRGDERDGDFYRLPFPNDVRLVDGHPDLSGHPSPETAFEVDMIGRYLRAAEQDLDGFGTNPTVYFRFSERYAPGSVDGALRWVNLTPGTTDDDRAHGKEWMTTYGRVSKYVCPNWLGVRRPHGDPLRPGETYAVLVDSGVEVEGGGSFARDDDLTALLASSAPADAALARAWDAYAPLRTWLAEHGEDPGTILNAAVFTTQRAEAVTSRLREAVRAAPRPTAGDLVLCADGVVSPCDDGTPARACGAEDPAFAEIHGRLSLPIFQQGTPPYEEPEDGGAIDVGADGLPLVARREDTCFALTVPRVAAPEAGFPLLVSLHGTGGSFRDAIVNGLAADVADGLAGGASVAAATLAIDLPQHGARRGGSTREPQALFFNFSNPRAARDNVAQGAADLHALLYFAEAFPMIAAAESPTGEAIAIDPAAIALFAHSQGATHASLAAPFETGLVAVVLSGNGGDLTLSLLEKREPVDVAALLPVALLDPDAEGALAAGDFHPALSLLQAYFDRVDPVNFGRRLARDPATDVPGRHAFMTSGVGDSYSPDRTQEAYARAARLAVVLPWQGEAWDAMDTAEAPLASNEGVGGARFTVGLRRYEPDAGDDGHFVSTATAAGRADVLRFLLAALAGQTPAIGE